MTRLPLPLFLTILTGCAASSSGQDRMKAAPTGRGQSCDSAGFLKAAGEAEKLRVKRRVSAEVFARMAKEPNTIVLDARGREDHAALRVKGSVNLPYTAMAEESLSRIIPEKDTRILIYCRNNLYDTRPPVPPAGSRASAGERGFPYPDEFTPPAIPKAWSAGLNIPTYITLYIYGYRNVWELDPAVDPNGSAIEFEIGPPRKS